MDVLFYDPYKEDGYEKSLGIRRVESLDGRCRIRSQRNGVGEFVSGLHNVWCLFDGRRLGVSRRCLGGRCCFAVGGLGGR